MAQQWALPVRFRQTVENMYNDGIKIFVEVGPRGNLTSFVEDTLKGRSFVAVTANEHNRSGIFQLNYMLGLLAAHGVQMRLDYLYTDRNSKRLPIFQKTLTDSGIRKENSANASKARAGNMKLTLALPELKLNESTSRESLEKQSLSPQPGQTQFFQERNTLFERNSEILSTLKNAALESQNDIAEPSGKPNRQLGRREAVMREYLNNMEEFIRLQEELMTTYFNKKSGRVKT
jgi:acyl transferase domain-containing protein